MVIYFRKEGRALGEVTKYLVYNAREYLLDVLGKIQTSHPRPNAILAQASVEQIVRAVSTEHGQKDRQTYLGDAGASEYFTRTENIAGVKVCEAFRCMLTCAC